jgi:hypothetical protein
VVGWQQQERSAAAERVVRVRGRAFELDPVVGNVTPAILAKAEALLYTVPNHPLKLLKVGEALFGGEPAV